MKIRRTLPPAAPPVPARSLFNGVLGLLSGARCVEEFKEKVRRYFGVRHVFPVSSGKAGLFLILRALGRLRPGKDWVVIPAFTCFSVPSSIVKAGFRVGLCDIDVRSFDYRHDLLEESVGEDTLCVVAGNLFGIPSDMDRINALCRERKVFVVDDAAQAMGVCYKGRKAGTNGDVGFFSFGRGKSITSGAGGMIVTNSEAIARELSADYAAVPAPGILEDLVDLAKVALLSVFIRPRLYWAPSGVPFLRLGETRFHRDFPVKKLSHMKAGLLREWQKYLGAANEVRERNAREFIERLGPDGTGIIPAIYLRLPFIAHTREARETLLDRSCERGLGLGRMYPSPVNEIAEIRNGLAGSRCPGAKFVSERLLTLPTHGFVSDADRREICTLLRGAAVGGLSGDEDRR